MSTKAVFVPLVVVLLGLGFVEGMKAQAGNPAQPSMSLKAATRATPPSTRQVIKVNNPYTQKMARIAGLDPAQPQVSNNGVRRGSDPSLASSECLLFETLVAKQDNLSPKEIEDFCQRTASADTSAKIEAAKSILEEHSGSRIDDALIHVVLWQEGEADGTWYQYSRHGGKWTGKLLSFASNDPVTELDHLLGHGNVAFLAIHLGVDDSCDISYTVEAKHVRPINQQDVSDLFQLVKDYYAKGTKGAAAPGGQIEESGKNIGVWGGATLLKLPVLPASIVLTPKTGNLPALKMAAHEPWETTTGCKPPKSAAGLLENPSELSKSGARSFVALRQAAFRRNSHSSRLSSSSLSPTGGASDSKDDSNKDPLASQAATVKDEGLHWWDVSVALPVTSYNKLKFDSENNFVTVKNTNDIKPYGLADIYFGGADLQAKNSLSTLRFSAGLPMASKPLQQPFFGGGFTLAIKSFRFSPLVGIRVQKEQRTTTLEPGTPANGAQLTNDLHSEWHAKLQVMIGFSIQDARKALGLK